jgi:hypothetical protein
MKKYWRWIVFGVVALVLVIALVLVGANKKLRQQIQILLMEKFTRNQVKDLEEQATVIRTKAENNEIEGQEAEAQAQKLDNQIKDKKDSLKKGLENKGMSADEISDRFNNLRI